MARPWIAGSGVFAGGFQFQRLLEGGLPFVVFLQADLRLSEIRPQHGLIGPQRGVLLHQGFDLGVFLGLDVLDLGVNVGFGSTGAELLLGRRGGAVGVLNILGDDAQVGIQVLDHFVCLERFGVVLAQLFQLLFLLLGQLVDERLPGHVVVLHRVLPGDDLDVVDGIDHLVRRGVHLAEDQAVGSGSRFPGELALRIHGKGVFVLAAVGGQADGSADPWLPRRRIGHLAVDLAHASPAGLAPAPARRPVPEG